VEWGLARKGFGISPKDDKSGLGCGKKDGCGLSSKVYRSGVWQVWLVWPWPRPSWTTLYTCEATKAVQLILFCNLSILLCFLPVSLQKLLWLRPSWTTMYTQCTHVQQVQLMRLSRVVLYRLYNLAPAWDQFCQRNLYISLDVIRRRRRRRKIATLWPRPSFQD
jgi:hypothetical protein